MANPPTTTLPFSPRIDSEPSRSRGLVAVVAESGIASVRELTLGASEGNRVVVETGLEPGELLIVTGQRGLISGQAVEVVEHQP